MRITSILLSIFTLVALAPYCALAQHELQIGMQAIHMNSGAARVLSQAENIKKKSQQTSSPQDSDTKNSHMDTVWQQYKAIDKGQPTPQTTQNQQSIGTRITNSNAQITNPALTTKDVRKAKPLRANQIINGYKKAQESRQQMRSLHFNTPSLDQKDNKNEP